MELAYPFQSRGKRNGSKMQELQSVIDFWANWAQ